ncbi:MAG: glycerophosphodiester phosphodiesterase [Leptospiraceae bacterium]|nr:glycerophosphodiester phosphodiesterase [Leptospiraceae bacterium]
MFGCRKLLKFRPNKSTGKSDVSASWFATGSLGLLLALWSACAGAPGRASDLQKLDLQGHRGARGLAPENTWPAFQKAIEYKMSTLELDTVLTKDDQIVVHHDSETNPVLCQNDDGTPIESRSLYNLTLAQLQQLDCGTLVNPKFTRQQNAPKTRLLSIGEFFQRVHKERPASGPALRFNIETKFPGDANATVAAARMEKHVQKLLAAISGADEIANTTIQSFYLPALLAVREQNRTIKTSALFAPSYFQGFLMLAGFGDGAREDILERAHASGVNIISPYYLYVTPGFVRQAHKYNMQVVPWTVNDAAEMKRLIQCGVDGIISDYPDVLRRVVDQLQAGQSVSFQ